jgi:hypothetical protein
LFSVKPTDAISGEAYVQPGTIIDRGLHVFSNFLTQLIPSAEAT